MRSLKQIIIGTTYRKVLKPVLFAQDPEKIHNRFIFIGHIMGKFRITRFINRLLFKYKNTMLEQTVFDIKFENPVGLSAGFDKDAQIIRILPEVGFGFMQVGSITFKPYQGNQRPRLYRLKKSQGIIVNYGLKNNGAKKIVKNLPRKPKHFLVSASVAKTNSRDTITTKDGIEDYAECLKILQKSKYFDFFTINISCPNAFGGEPFAEPKKLDRLLKKIHTLGIDKPIFLKMPINEKWSNSKLLIEVAIKNKIDGLIIGNLDKNRSNPQIKDQIPKHIKGGISGKPTWSITNELISKTYKNYGDKIKIIGVGGIFSAQDAYEKIKRGATLVQLITGMIFEGPQLIGEINRGLVELLKKDGYTNISDAIGANHSKHLG